MEYLEKTKNGTWYYTKNNTRKKIDTNKANEIMLKNRNIKVYSIG